MRKLDSNSRGTVHPSQRKAGGRLQHYAYSKAKRVALIRQYEKDPNPPMKRPGIGAIPFGREALDLTTGLPTLIAAARRLHSGGGGQGALALSASTPMMGFRFPKFMSPVARRTGAINEYGIPKVENTQIWDNLIQKNPSHLGEIYEKRLGHMSPFAPLSPGHMVAKNDSFMAHLARLHDEAANREFLNWMMQHHYRRPN